MATPNIFQRQWVEDNEKSVPRNSIIFCLSCYALTFITNLLLLHPILGFAPNKAISSLAIYLIYLKFILMLVVIPLMMIGIICILITMSKEMHTKDNYELVKARRYKPIKLFNILRLSLELVFIVLFVMSGHPFWAGAYTILFLSMEVLTFMFKSIDREFICGLTPEIVEQLEKETDNV